MPERITSFRLDQHDLPLISVPGRAETQRQVALLSLATRAGRRGFGECAPLPGHGSESAALAFAALRQAAEKLIGAALPVADDLAAGHGWAALAAELCPTAPAARAAVECALLDLAAQRAALPLWVYLRRLAGAAPPATPHSAPAAAPRVNALAGRIAALAPGDLARFAAAGYRVIKIKLSASADDLSRLRRLAAELPPAVRLRLDFNRALTLPAAAALADALPDLPLDHLEEPLARHAATPLAAHLAALAELQHRLPWPLALDETACELAAPANRELRERFFAEAQQAYLERPIMEAPTKSTPFALSLSKGISCENNGFDRLSPNGVNQNPAIHSPQPGAAARLRLVCKLAPLGGLVSAFSLARQAAAAGIVAVVTTGIDGACASRAAAHLAAAIAEDGGDLAHGLATAALLQRDLGAPPIIRRGRLLLDAAPGLGFTPTPGGAAA